MLGDMLAATWRHLVALARDGRDSAWQRSCSVAVREMDELRLTSCHVCPEIACAENVLTEGSAA
jgi:hypothetical protein